MPREFEMRLHMIVGDEPGAGPTVLSSTLVPIETAEAAEDGPNSVVAEAWQDMLEEYEEQQEQMERQIASLQRELSTTRAVLADLQSSQEGDSFRAESAPAMPPPPVPDPVPAPQLVVIEPQDPLVAPPPAIEPPSAAAPLFIGQVTQPVVQSQEPKLEVVVGHSVPDDEKAAFRPIATGGNPILRSAAAGRAVGTSTRVEPDFDDFDPGDPLLPEPWYKRTFRFAFGGPRF